MEDLYEVNKRLEASEMSSVARTLRPTPSSTTSMEGDSGISTRNVSTSSLVCHKVNNFVLMEPINDEDEQPSAFSPVLIKVEETDSDATVETKFMKPSFSESNQLLSIPRKFSTGSATSEEYETPSTTPTISRKISVESSASPSTAPQAVHIRVEIHLPASNEKITVNTSAIIHKKLKQLQLNFFFTPTSSRHSPIQRSNSTSSSSSSTPNSPNVLNKKLIPSKSLDEQSPPSSPYPIQNDDREGEKIRRRSRNNLISGIVRKNVVEFVDSTDIESLCPHLYANELLSHKDMQELDGIKSVRGKKNFLYLLLLDTKGVNAYQKLFDGLKNETQHCGHRDLVKIIESGLDQDDL